MASSSTIFEEEEKEETAADYLLDTSPANETIESVLRGFKASIPFLSPDSDERKKMTTAFQKAGQFLLDALKAFYLKGEHSSYTIDKIHQGFSDLLEKNKKYQEPFEIINLFLYACKTNNPRGLDYLAGTKQFKIDYTGTEGAYALHVAAAGCIRFLLEQKCNINLAVIDLTGDKFPKGINLGSFIVTAIQQDMHNHLEEIAKYDETYFHTIYPPAMYSSHCNQISAPANSLYMSFMLANKTTFDWILLRATKFKKPIKAEAQDVKEGAVLPFYDAALIQPIKLTETHVKILEVLLEKNAIGEFGFTIRQNLVAALFAMEKYDLCRAVLDYWDDKSWHKHMLNALFNGRLQLKDHKNMSYLFLQYLSASQIRMNANDLVAEPNSPMFTQTSPDLRETAAGHSRIVFQMALNKGKKELEAKAAAAAAPATVSDKPDSIFHYPAAAGGGADVAVKVEAAADGFVVDFSRATLFAST